MPEYRAHFDFDIRFANGGALAGTGFRLDLPSADLSEDDIGRLLVRHLGLALVEVRAEELLVLRALGVHLPRHVALLVVGEAVEALLAHR